MNIARFIESLNADGRVRVPPLVDRNGILLHPSNEELDEARDSLIRFEREYRNDLPGAPPCVSEPAMLWGAMAVFRTCCFIAHRDAPADLIRGVLEQPCPASPSPSVCYSVDLTMRFMPDFVRLAKAASEQDPLVPVLVTLAHQWPLSSVGIPQIEPTDVSQFIDDDCLLRMYIDRILAKKDSSRLQHPKVRDAIRGAIGLHRELAPELASSLDSLRR